MLCKNLWMKMNWLIPISSGSRGSLTSFPFCKLQLYVRKIGNYRWSIYTSFEGKNLPNENKSMEKRQVWRQCRIFAMLMFLMLIIHLIRVQIFKKTAFGLTSSIFLIQSFFYAPKYVVLPNSSMMVFS